MFREQVHNFDEIARSVRIDADAEAVAIHGSDGISASGLLGSDGLAAPRRAALAVALDSLPLPAPEAIEQLPVPPLGFESAISALLHRDGPTLIAIVVLDPAPERLAELEGEVMLRARRSIGSLIQARLRAELERLSSELRGVESLDALIAEEESSDDLGQRLAWRAAAVIGAQSAALMVFDEERGTLQLLPGAFGVEGDILTRRRTKFVDSLSHSARVFELGVPSVNNEAEGDPGIRQDIADQLQLKRLLSVPLRAVAKKVGVVHLADKAEPFSAADVSRVQALAPRIAMAVELGSSLRSLRHQRRSTSVLVDTALGISGGREVNDLVRSALGRVGDLIGATAVAVVKTGDEQIVWRGPEAQQRMIDRLLREGIRHASLRPTVRELGEATTPGYSGEFLAVRLAGKQIASLAVLRPQATAFADTEREVLRRLADLVAVGLATERYQRQRAEVATLRDRQRIADDLHDKVAQLIFAAQLNLDSVLEDEAAEPEKLAEIARARSFLLKGDMAIREVIHQLSQPTRGDLVKRLGLMINGLEEEFQATIRLEVPEPVAEAAKRLRDSTTAALVKGAREATVNAIKHAGPCTISIRIKMSGQNRLLVTVSDDGGGVRGSGGHRGHGLDAARRVLRDSGGILRVYAGRDGGTKVVVSVPL